MRDANGKQTSQISHAEEEIALQELKAQLKVGNSVSHKDTSSSGEDLPTYNAVRRFAIDGYLVRFLRSQNFSVPEAINKLKQRRNFERMLPDISMSPTLDSIIHSGALRALGRDSQGNHVLFVDFEQLTITTLDPSERRRLIIVLLEYMQSLCMLSSKSITQDDMPTEDCLTTISFNNTFQTHPHMNQRSITISTIPKLTLLVENIAASWETYSTLLRGATDFYTIVEKYYPCFLDRVFLLESDPQRRKALEVHLAQLQKKLSYVINVVDNDGLNVFLPKKVIPKMLGSVKPPRWSTDNFAEAVLHYWRALMSTIRCKTKMMHIHPNDPVRWSTGALKCSMNVSWPLYIPPLFAMSTSHFLGVQKISQTHVGGRGIKPCTLTDAITYKTPLLHSPTSVVSSLEILPTLYSIEDVDSLHDPRLDAEDDFCSFFSEDNQDSLECRHHPLIKARLDKATLKQEFVDAKELERIKVDPGYAVQALKQERVRGFVLEEKLYKAEAYASPSSEDCCPIARHLSELHGEINMLLSDVLSRAKSLCDEEEPPSLVELLDCTLTALETAANIPEQVPILSLMQPRQTEAKVLGCCNII